MSKETIPGKLLIYGATGYTGTMICHEAARRGIDFEIAGRNAEKLSILSAQLQVPFHAFEVDDISGWQQSLYGRLLYLISRGHLAKQQRWQWKPVCSLKCIMLILQQKLIFTALRNLKMKLQKQLVS